MVQSTENHSKMWPLLAFSQLGMSFKMVAHLAAENLSSLKLKEFSSSNVWTYFPPRLAYSG
jgi:hypothetical protein